VIKLGQVDVTVIDVGSPGVFQRLQVTILDVVTTTNDVNVKFPLPNPTMLLCTPLHKNTTVDPDPFTIPED
jgi:hypothetical protein